MAGKFKIGGLSTEDENGDGDVNTGMDNEGVLPSEGGPLHLGDTFVVNHNAVGNMTQGERFSRLEFIETYGEHNFKRLCKLCAISEVTV